MHRYGPLALVVLVYLIIGSLFAIYTPDWQAPDEPAHFNYIRQLATGKLPIIEPGDYNQEYQSLVISSKFDPQYPVESFEYEDYQPPLYYLLQSPVFLLTGGLLRPMRLFSVLLGAGVIILTYLITSRIFSGKAWLALTAAVFVAFLPQHVAMLAAVNNDSLAELIIAGILLVLILLVGGMSGETAIELQTTSQTLASTNQGLLILKLVFLGVLLGLGFLTKVTVYIMVPIVGLVLIWLFWGRWRDLMKALLIVFGIAGLMGLVWWTRNLIVYGGLDILGTGAHNAIVVGQPRTAEWIADRGLFGTFQAFTQTTFQSFWGQFGWMGVVMPIWIYRPLLLFSLVTGVGLAWAALHEGSRWVSVNRSGEFVVRRPSTIVFMVLLGTLAISLLLYVGYNLTFVQHQGRYLFPALVPISIGFAIAWSMLLRPIARRWSGLMYLFPLSLAVGLVLLDLLALFWFIVPALEVK